MDAISEQMPASEVVNAEAPVAEVPAEEQQAEAEEVEAEAEEEEEEEEDDYEIKYTFAESEYWQHFHGKTPDHVEFYDWYTAEELIINNILRLAPDRENARIIDIGTGTCPLLFTLAKDHGYKQLCGVDFSERAITFLQNQCQEQELTIDFQVADATNMEGFADHSFDIIVDKGCLDCFTNSKSWDCVHKYMREVKRLLAPGGRLLLVAVASIHPETLLDFGLAVREDEVPPRIPRENFKPMAIAIPADETPLFVVEKVRAKDERHLYILNPDFTVQGLPKPLDPTSHHYKIECEDCDAVYSGKLPRRCRKCSNAIVRFFV